MFSSSVPTRNARGSPAIAASAAPSHADRRASRAPGIERRATAFERVRHVAEVVAAERLVAAVAAERDGDVPPRLPRDVLGRNRRRVGERLVEAVDDAIEHLVEARLDDLGVMLRL